MNHFGQNFHFCSLAVIFSKFLDGIKENAPKHQKKVANFLKFEHLCLYSYTKVKWDCADAFARLRLCCSNKISTADSFIQGRINSLKFLSQRRQKVIIKLIIKLI